MKLHLQVSLKNCFPITLSASLYQCQVSIVGRKKNIEQTIFRLFVKFIYQDQQHPFIDITMIIRGEIKVFLCFHSFFLAQSRYPELCSTIFGNVPTFSKVVGHCPQF